MLKHERVRYTHKINGDLLDVLLCDKLENGINSLSCSLHAFRCILGFKKVVDFSSREKRLYHTWISI